MVANDKKLIKRRGFVTDLARFGAAGLLGGLAVFGESKRRRLLREGKCVGGGICGSCSVFGDCRLPCAIGSEQGRQDVGGTEGGE